MRTRGGLLIQLRRIAASAGAALVLGGLGVGAASGLAATTAAAKPRAGQMCSASQVGTRETAANGREVRCVKTLEKGDRRHYVKATTRPPEKMIDPGARAARGRPATGPGGGRCGC
jgi:hypothetical protein